jgi:hypothetical protein
MASKNRLLGALITDDGDIKSAKLDTGLNALAGYDNKTYSYSGDLAINTGSKRLYMSTGLTLDAVDAYLETAPTGAAAIFTLKKNGSSIGTVTIADGTTTVTDTSFSEALVRGDYLTVDITQIGSSTVGADLYINFRFIG